jgi:hypothetical protein
MMKRARQWCLFLLLLQLSLPALAASSDSLEAFKLLTGLLGDWTGKSGSGREHKVNYRLSAGGSVLVETWSLPSGRESMTLYHLDGESLMATHYCPQGNQPRLVLMPGDKKMHFAFLDGTNLQVAGKSHQYSFWLQIDDEDHFRRNEIYVENNALIEPAPIEDPAETFSYTRTKDAGAVGK